MKKKCSLIFLLFSSFLLSSCFGLWHHDEYTVLENCSAVINPDKETYYLDEFPELIISSAANFFEYDKYVFTIKVEEFNELSNSCEKSKNTIFIDNNNEIKDSEINFEYEKSSDETQKLEKSIFIRFLKTGVFYCYAYVHAYQYYENGGFGSNCYNTGWCLKLENRQTDLQNVIKTLEANHD